jgi:hypothetical protein
MKDDNILPPHDSPPQPIGDGEEYDYETNEIVAVPYEFPVDCLPDLAQEFIRRQSKSLDVALEVIASPLLATIATCLGVLFRVTGKKDHVMPINLWVVMMGNSGDRKSPSIKSSTNMLWDLQAEFHLVATSESPPDHNPPRIIASDVTFEALATILQNNPAMMIHADELMSWFQSLTRYSGSSSMNDWLALYNGSPFTHDRKGEGASLAVGRNAVSIVGSIQSARTPQLFNQQVRDAGLLARFLLIRLPRKRNTYNWSSDDDSSLQDVSNKLRERLRQILTHSYKQRRQDQRDGGVITVEPNPDARKVYTNYYESLQDRKESTSNSGLQAHLSKLEELPYRLAAILHLFDDYDTSEPKLTAETMEAGIRLANYFVDKITEFYLTGLIDDPLNVLEKLDDGKPYTVRQLQRKYHRSPLSDDLEKSLIRFAQAGYLTRCSPDDGTPIWTKKSYPRRH